MLRRCHVAVDENRTRFRETVMSLQAAELEQVVPMISQNVKFFLATNTSIFMQVKGGGLIWRDGAAGDGSWRAQCEHPMCCIGHYRRCWRSWTGWSRAL
jgi:hypothetical protein